MKLVLTALQRLYSIKHFHITHTNHRVHNRFPTLPHTRGLTLLGFPSSFWATISQTHVCVLISHCHPQGVTRISRMSLTPSRCKTTCLSLVDKFLNHFGSLISILATPKPTSYETSTYHVLSYHLTSIHLNWGITFPRENHCALSRLPL